MSANRADAGERRRIVVAIVVVIVSILLSTIYGLLSYFKGEPGNAFTAVSYGIILSLLFSCLGLLFDLIFSLNSLRIVSQGLKNSADFEKLLKLIKDSRATMEAIHLSVNGDQEGSEKILRLSKLPEGIIRDTGDRAFTAYQQDFRVIGGGIRTEGEAWAFKSYGYFWEHLLDEQKKRRQEDEKSIIVRITHSNSVSIWDAQHPDVLHLLELQKAFVGSGGRIARIFLGDEPGPNPKYESVLSSMRKMGIAAFYLQLEKTHLRLPYDFLWVSDLDVTVKWYSGAGGTSLGTTEILKVSESAARDLKLRWDALWRQLCEQSETRDPYLTQEIEATFCTVR